MTIGVVIAAAGSGRRMGAEVNKVLLPLQGRPVLAHSLTCFGSMDEVSELVVVTSPVDQEEITELVQQTVVNKATQVILGGAERQDSVYLGLKALPPHTDLVIIHDGARPFITQELVRKGLRSAQEHRAVGIAVPVKDTIKRVRDAVVVETPNRSELWAIQTPQIFAYDLVLRAHEEARAKGILATDDCGLLEAMGQPVHIVEGDYANIKITTPEDLPTATEVSSVGFGYDVHRLTLDRPLILAGIEIPHTKGLLGHSDADVVTHAIMDALLGAMGQGDIGELFPDTDPKYKGISSLTLLDEVLVMLQQKKLAVNNMDITIMAQRPRLGVWKSVMRKKLAEVMAISESQINIKATTTESLGFVGREEGIATQVVVSLRTLV